MMHHLYLKFFVILSLTVMSCQPHTVPLSNPITTTLNLSTAPTIIAYGSCNKQYKDQSFWAKIDMQKPDLFVWMGDIVYSDTDNPADLQKEYNNLKTNKHYADFIVDRSVIGVWDDHDYGLNDGGLDNPIKNEARDIMFDFLDVPKNSLEYKHKGAYQSYTFGEGDKSIKFFLLDARYFRDVLIADPSKKERYLHDTLGTILGQTQWQWLEDELNSSTASVNILVNGIQVLSQEHKFEKWENFPNERKKLLSLIENSPAKNTYIWSGDRHVAEVSKITFDSNQKDLYDITCSGMTHSYEKANETNKHRISPLVGLRNYGLLKLDWQKDSLHITHQIKGFKGQTFIDMTQSVKL